MKNSLFFLAFLSMFCLNAQNAPITFEPNEPGSTWTWTVFENASNPALEIIANPDQTGANTSATVAKFAALQAGAPWVGCESQHGADIGTFTLTAATAQIKIMVWKTTISDVGIKLVDAGNGSLGEIKVANTKVNEWEELTFDFTSRIGIAYDQIVIFPDFIARTQDNVIYFDNITFGLQTPQATPMVAAPTPTIPANNVISMFSNAYTNVPVDTWQTPWSVGVLSDIQIAGNDTKLYNSINFVGIETTAANLIDASDMLYFHVDVWTPNMTTFRIKLVDFGADLNFAGGDDTEHELIFENPAKEEWISYHLPLADFTNLANRNHIAQLIFSGNPAGNGTAYIDNVYFSTLPVATKNISTVDCSVFPNPMHDNLEVRAAETMESVVIYNSLGQQVLRQLVGAKNASLDVSNLEIGVYFAEITILGKKQMLRVVRN